MAPPPVGLNKDVPPALHRLGAFHGLHSRVQAGHRPPAGKIRVLHRVVHRVVHRVLYWVCRAYIGRLERCVIWCIYGGVCTCITGVYVDVNMVNEKVYRVMVTNVCDGGW